MCRERTAVGPRFLIRPRDASRRGPPPRDPQSPPRGWARRRRVRWRRVRTRRRARPRGPRTPLVPGTRPGASRARRRLRRRMRPRRRPRRPRAPRRTRRSLFQRDGVRVQPPPRPPRPPRPPAVSRAGPTPLIDPSAVPEVLRAVALEDGCVKVNFRDNTVLALDPTGAAFTAHAPDGESVRQLADFAVTRFANKLRLALEFRNAHVDVPYYPPAVMLRGRRSSSSRTTENPTSASGTPLLARSGARGASPSRGGAATRRPRRGRAS